MAEMKEAKRANGDGSATLLGVDRGAKEWRIRVSLENPLTGKTERFSRNVEIAVKRRSNGSAQDRAREKALDSEIARLRTVKER